MKASLLRAGRGSIVLWQERSFVTARTLSCNVWFHWSSIPPKERKKKIYQVLKRRVSHSALFPHWDKVQVLFQFGPSLTNYLMEYGYLELFIFYNFISSSAFSVLLQSCQNWTNALALWLKNTIKVRDSTGLMVNYQEEKLWPTWHIIPAVIN